MATSVSNNAYGIIADAMVDAGLLQKGSRPDSDDLAVNMRRLNDLINLWQTQGLKLFLQEDVVVPLVVGQTNLPMARKIARALKPFNTFWHEDAIRMDSLDLLQQYAQ